MKTLKKCSWENNLKSYFSDFWCISNKLVKYVFPACTIPVHVHLFRDPVNTYLGAMLMLRINSTKDNKLQSLPWRVGKDSPVLFAVIFIASAWDYTWHRTDAHNGLFFLSLFLSIFLSFLLFVLFSFCCLTEWHFKHTNTNGNKQR